MSVTVNRQAQQFHLALKESWAPAVGHAIQIGEYTLCAIPLQDGLNISEATSGNGIMDVPIEDVLYEELESEDDFFIYLEGLGHIIDQLIEDSGDFDIQLADMLAENIERLGEMPPIVDVDVSQLWGRKDGE